MCAGSGGVQSTEPHNRRGEGVKGREIGLAALGEVNRGTYAPGCRRRAAARLLAEHSWFDPQALLVPTATPCMGIWRDRARLEITGVTWMLAVESKTTKAAAARRSCASPLCRVIRVGPADAMHPLAERRSRRKRLRGKLVWRDMDAQLRSMEAFAIREETWGGCF